jgi:hypothetical protein
MQDINFELQPDFICFRRLYYIYLESDTVLLLESAKLHKHLFVML